VPLIRLICTGTASPQLNRMLLMISILMMRLRKFLIRLEKITVDDVKDEQDFRLDDEVTEDSTEQ
jgi:hypothetical protein